MNETEKLVEVDSKNLRFYAAMFREYQWQTDALHWSVFTQTLNEIAERYSGLRAENERLKALISNSGWIMPEDMEKLLAENERLKEDVIREKAFAQSSEYNLVQEIQHRQKLEQDNAALKEQISARIAFNIVSSLNERISAWFEPRNVSASRKGFWRLINNEWQPLDYDTDEAANARLLEAMRKPLLVSDWPGCEGWRVDLGVEYFDGPPKGPTHKDRKTAIVMAFCKFAGIEP